MKRSLLVLFVLLLAMLLLAACGTKPPAETTATPTTAAPTTTGSATTAAPTTTAPVTTAPTPVVENPIKEVTVMASGGLKIKLTNNTSLTLGSVKTRTGYNNSATVLAPVLDDNGVLTLSLLDGAAENAANKILEVTPTPVTLRLRERDGNLEWAAATGDDWQILCPADATASEITPLTLLAEKAGIGGTLPTDGRMIFTINGNEVRFRARDWMANGMDMCQVAYLHASTNNNFNLSAMYEISSTTPAANTATATGTTFKATDDEICPTGGFHNNWVGANHGYNLVSSTSNPAGLTEDDIGLVFSRSSDGQKYVLIRATASNLWFVPFDDEAMRTGNFGSYYYGNKGKLASGNTLRVADNGEAMNGTTTFTITGTTSLLQMKNSTNHASQRAFINGTIEVDLTKDGTYFGEFIDFYETYDAIYLPAMLTYLQENLYYNDNDSYHSDAIEEAYFTYTGTYRFHKNGSYSVYYNSVLHKDVKGFKQLGVMSIGFGSSQYIYAPNSNISTPTRQNFGTDNAVYIYGEDGAHIRSFYQFTNASGAKGMNVGYHPHYGLATDEMRDDMLVAENGAEALANGTLKMYPNIINLPTSVTTEAGFVSSFIGYHTPTVKLDDDFFAINWHWVGDDIYLSMHTDKAVAEKTVALPDYLVGLAVTVDEKSDSFTVLSDTIGTDGITVSTTGAGYVTIKLTAAN